MTPKRRKYLARIVFWTGMLPIAVLAVPVMFLLGLIRLIRAGADRILKKLGVE